MIERLNALAAAPMEHGGNARKDVVDAAGQFESLLIAQLLRSMREAGGSSGWLGSGEDSTSASAMQMAEEHFAAALARQGGLGLAKMVAAGLEENAKSVSARSGGEPPTPPR
jgi:Rod binding domain-containing protein